VQIPRGLGRASRFLPPISVLAVVVGIVVGASAAATPAGADSLDVGVGPYYVAIGASESVGVQPAPGHPHGVPTDDGYADDLTKMEQARWPGLRLVDFGCPGITAQGALDGVGRCRYAAGSEVATAARFIREHRDEVALVTVDLGYNDLWPCLAHHLVDAGCADAAIRRIGDAIPEVLAALRAAGGPDLLIVGLQHADPYVADARFGEVDFARSTVPIFDRMNDVLTSAYADAGAIVAHVPGPRGGNVGPDAVADACARTWMCRDHNIHPTDDGYRLIAGAVATAIARSQSTGG
jgi:lysophospholipase L1-like esterase